MSPNSEDKHHEGDFRLPRPIKWQSVQRNTLGVKNPKTSLCHSLISALQAVEPCRGESGESQSTSEGSSVTLQEVHALVVTSGWLREGDAHPLVFKKLSSLT